MEHMIFQPLRKRKSAVFCAIAFLLIVCMLTGCAGKGLITALPDYASAGAYVMQKYVERSGSFTVIVHTDEYNPILGPSFVWEKVHKEAVAHNGDPGQGDHLAIGVKAYSLSTKVLEKEDGSHDLEMTVKPTYTVTVEQEDALAQAADTILRSLKLDGASDYDKALAIYRYICDNVTYDESHLGDDSYLLQYTAYAAAVQGTAVCAGIADLFYYLANAAGLDARIRANDTHAWNFVRVDGKYYYADATWDLGRSEEEYEFFLKGSADFQLHAGNVSFGPGGFGDVLMNPFLQYDFSTWAYGYDPYAF